MPQLTPAQARVSDPVLTEVAQGYRQAGRVGYALFPRVDVKKRGGKIITFGREHLKQYAQLIRAPGSDVETIQVGYGSGSYTLDDYAIAGMLPMEIQGEADEVPGIDLASVSMFTALDIVQTRLEIQQATLATTAASYPAANKITKSGTGQWSDQTSGVSDPMLDIEIGKEAVRAATGMPANTVVLSAAAYSKCRTHPKIVDRIKYTGREVATPEILAALFGVDRVAVGGAFTSNDAETANTDAWGKFVVVAYTVPETVANRGAPTFGYTYTLEGFPYARPMYFNEGKLSWMFPVLGCEKPVVTQINAGYLISAAVA